MNPSISLTKFRMFYTIYLLQRQGSLSKEDLAKYHNIVIGSVNPHLLKMKRLELISFDYLTRTFELTQKGRRIQFVHEIPELTAAQLSKSSFKRNLTIFRNDTAFQCKYPGCANPIRYQRKYCAGHRCSITRKPKFSKINISDDIAKRILKEIVSNKSGNKIQLSTEHIHQIVHWSILREQNTPIRLCFDCEKRMLNDFCEKCRSKGLEGITAIESQSEFAGRIKIPRGTVNNWIRRVIVCYRAKDPSIGQTNQEITAFLLKRFKPSDSS